MARSVGIEHVTIPAVEPQRARRGFVDVEIDPVAFPVRTEEIEVPVEVDVDDAHAVGAIVRDDDLGEGGAVVPINLDLVGVAALFHLRGCDVHIAVAIEVTGADEMVNRLNRAIHDVLAPARLFGIIGSLEPGDPVAVALELGRREQHVEMAVRVHIGDRDECGIVGPRSRIDVLSPGLDVGTLVLEPYLVDHQVEVLITVEVGRHQALAIGNRFRLAVPRGRGDLRVEVESSAAAAKVALVAPRDVAVAVAVEVQHFNVMEHVASNQVLDPRWSLVPVERLLQTNDVVLAVAVHIAHLVVRRKLAARCDRPLRPRGVFVPNEAAATPSARD